MSNTITQLSTEAQDTFTSDVQSEIHRIIANLDQRWENKPTVSNSSYATQQNLPVGARVSYRKPSLQAIEIRSDFGFAAFVTEEQIDYDPWAGAQLRHELFVLTAGMQTAERKYEYTAHESEGNMFTEIKEIAPESVTIETAKGTQTIAIG